MTRDLRDLLDDAAGSPRDLPDMRMIRRRARPVLLRRRAALALMLLSLIVASIAGAVELRDEGSDRGGGVVDVPRPEPAVRDLREGQLEPGVYGGQVGAYRLRLTLATDDWSLITAHDTWLAFTYRQYAVHMQVWGGVVPDNSQDASDIEATPRDIVSWLENNDRVNATAKPPVIVGGNSATEILLRVARPLPRPSAECFTSRCVVLARIAGVDELVHIESGERARVLVLGDPGEQVVITYRASEDEFATVDRAARRLLAGLRLTRSQ